MHLDAFSGVNWFRVGVSSPDDIDKDLDFSGDECAVHDAVVEYIKGMDKIGVFYDEVLNDIQKRFGGTRTS